MASHLVSRREQYDVYAAVLLLEKYGNVNDSKAGEVKEVTEEITMAMQPYVEAGLLGEDLQPKDLSNPETAYIVSCISQKLWQKNRWKPFEKLWGISSLASYYQRLWGRKSPLSS